MTKTGKVCIVVEVRSHKEVSSEFEVDFVSLDKILPHEEIIPSELERVKDSLKNDGELRYPIVVAKGYYVLLDGHHRWSALLDMGYAKAPCILFDYFNDKAIMVDTWYPRVQINFKDFIDELKALTPEANFVSLQLSDALEAKATVDGRKYGVILTNGLNYVGVEDDREHIMKLLRSHFLKKMIYYDSWQLATEEARNHNHVAVLTHSYSKAEIIDAARKGIVFTPKTTRHVIPRRYPRINMPLNEIPR